MQEKSLWSIYVYSFPVIDFHLQKNLGHLWKGHQCLNKQSIASILFFTASVLEERDLDWTFLHKTPAC